MYLSLLIVRGEVGLYILNLDVKKEGKMKSQIVFTLILFILCAFSVQGFAAQVDISDRVSWDASSQMYVPNTYTHYWYFNTTYSGKNATGAVWLDINVGTTYCDMYFSLDTKYSSSDSRLTRVTMDAFTGHDASYSQVDFGYLPSGSGDPSLSYDIFADDDGLGEAKSLDWQYAADNPMPQNSVYPGSTYYSKLENGEVFSFDDGTELGIDGKIQTNTVSFMAGPGGTTAIPELPPGVFIFLGPMIGFGLTWIRRFFF